MAADEGVGMIEGALNWLAEPLVSSLIGITTFIVSTLLAIHLYFRARPLSQLNYASYDVQILTKRFPNLAEDFEILHKGTPVPEATATVAAIWNSGNQTINESQIVRDDPLRFEVGEGKKILKAHIIATVRNVNNIRVTIDLSERLLLTEFDYMDAGDGFIAMITHTGAPGQCTLTGSVKGVKQGPRLQRVSRTTRLLAPLVTVVMLLVVVFGLTIAGVELGSGATLFTLMFVTAIPALAPNLLVSRRGRSFPRELRSNPNAKGLLPFLLQGDVA